MAEYTKHDREWVYENPSWNTKGVTLTDTRLEWWETGHSFAGGGLSEQSLDDFLCNGPAVEGVPAEVLAELTSAVKAKLK